MYGKRVLLVEDDNMIRLIFSETLRRVGVIVIEAENACHALEQLSEGILVDAVITDFSMPGMNGIQLAETLGGQYPLMLVSSDNLETEVANAPSVTKFKRKPLTPVDLVEGVRKLFALSCRE